MEYVGSVLSDYVLTDKRDKPSLMGCFSVIQLATVPGGLPRFFASGTYLIKLPVQEKLTLRISDEAGTWNFVIVQDFEFPGKHSPLADCGLALTGVNAEIQGCEFPSYGLYWLESLCDGQLIGRAPLYIRKLGS